MRNVTPLVFGVPVLDIRLWFHMIAFVHLLITAVVTLSIDPTVDEDPRVKIYITVRWKLLTCWFNLITLVYLPLCLYCEMKEKRGFADSTYVQKLRHATDVLMTSIIFPTTMGADILFWAIMSTKVELMAPPKIFEYLPYWSQHSLHSVSMAVVVLDLVLTPRSQPKSLVPRFLLSISFITAYALTIYISYLRGVVVYAFLDIFSISETMTFVWFSYFLYTSFFFIQWKIIYLVWGCPEKIKYKKKV